MEDKEKVHIKRRTTKKGNYERKKETRKNHRESEIKKRLNVKEYEIKFNEMEPEDLKQLALDITKKLELINDSDTDKIILESQLAGIKRVIQKRPKLLSKDSHIFSYYPDLDNPNFNLKIFNKKEFNENKINIQNYDIEELSQERCHAKKWKALPNQIFLKNFISLHTPYNGLLLWHGTGVGKTCSAITIAEQFKDVIKREGKKIFVLLSPSIKDNFKKQIFNSDKLGKIHFKKLSDISHKEIFQCTGNKYLKELDDMVIEDNEYLNKKINKIINTHYNFMGYDSFANYVTKLEEECIKGYDPSMKDSLQRKMRKKMFSDTIFIIDEAHHIRTTGENSKKIAPPVIERVIKDSDNVKLILLTATPMYNSQVEIIWLLNLLLQNDKKPVLYMEEVFDTKGNLTSEGLKILKDKSRGYISYLRSENPYSFPLRLYPDINDDEQILDSSNAPYFNMAGTEIKDELKLKYLKLINSDMSEIQYKIYRKSVTSLMRNDSEYEELFEDDEDEEQDRKKDSGYSEIEKGLQISNFIYPSVGIDTEDEEELNINNYYGNKGFDKSFDTILTKNGKKYRYNKSTHKKFGNFLKCSKDSEKIDGYQLSDFSSKMDSIIKYIYNSEGIVYIYSQFITSGVLPLALALEQNGFKKYGDDQLLDIPEYSKKNSDCKSEPISYQGKRLSEYEKKEDFKQARYIIITGNDSISKNNDQEIYNSTLKNNKFGEKIKVILGSPIAGEGLDMKRIREIHILDPWHHLNRIEQVIGRGIRNCSHSDLDLKHRNCTIFMHVATGNADGEYAEEFERETIDIRVYRKGEQKSIKMGIIEKELKKNAIDCLLNTQGNIYSEIDWNQNIDIETSQKINTSYKIGDKPYSKICNYQKDCLYKCEPESKDMLEIDNDTYNINFAKPKIYNVIDIIKEMYTKDYIYDLEDIVKHVSEIMRNIETFYIYNALDIMVNDQSQYLLDRLNRYGRIIYKGGYYIFQPQNIIDTNIPLYYRNKPLEQQMGRISLQNNYHFQDMEDRRKWIKESKKSRRNNFSSILTEIKTYVNHYSLEMGNDDLWSEFIKKDSERVSQILYDRYIDRLSSQSKSFILDYLCKKINFDLQQKNNLSKEEISIFKSLTNYFLFQNRDIIKNSGKESPTPLKIVGYRIFENNQEIFYTLQKGELKKYSLSIEGKIRKFSEIIAKPSVPESNINGYMDVLDRDKYDFKLVDTSTTNTRKSRKSTGAICDQINSKESIGKLINNVSEKIKYEKRNFKNYDKKQSKTKGDMCVYLENLLRYRELQNHRKLKWFYRTNEKQ